VYLLRINGNEIYRSESLPFTVKHKPSGDGGYVVACCVERDGELDILRSVSFRVVAYPSTDDMIGIGETLTFHMSENVFSLTRPERTNT